MKTIKKITIVLLMLISLQVFSADLSIKIKNDDAVEVRVNSISENENIKIYDKYGEILFSESIDENNYLKVFTLMTLPEGEYFIEYENDRQINVASVKKDANGIILMSDFDKIQFKPVITQNDEFINVGLTNHNRKNVDIEIRDFDGNKLVDIEAINEFFVKKTFDTSKLTKGDYTVRVWSDKDVFTKRITIE